MNKYLVTLNTPVNNDCLTANGRQSLLDAARRWGADYIEISSPFGTHHYRSKIQYDLRLPEGRICYVDGDVVLRSDCPSPFEVVPSGELGLVRSHHPSHSGPTSHVLKILPPWLDQVGSVGDYDIEAEYPNTGMVVFDLPRHRPLWDEARKIAEAHWHQDWAIADQGHVFAAYKRLGIKPVWVPVMMQHHGEDLWAGWTPTMDKLGYHFCGPIDKKIGGEQTNWWQQGPDRYTPKKVLRWTAGKPRCLIGGPELPFYLRAVTSAHKERCVEVGCFFGGLTWYGAQIARDNYGEWVSVDSWCGASPDLPQNWDWHDIKCGFDMNMRDAKLDGFVETRHMSSVEASKLEADGSLGFVFLDGNHTYQGLTTDIDAWLPKLKKGGIMLGHDYSKNKFPGVVQAVNNRFGSPESVSKGEYAIWKVTKK